MDAQPPALGLIMVGDRKDSALYVRNKQKACRSTGIQSVNYLFEEDVSQVSVCTHLLISGNWCSILIDG